MIEDIGLEIEIELDTGANHPYHHASAPTSPGAETDSFDFSFHVDCTHLDDKGGRAAADELFEAGRIRSITERSFVLERDREWERVICSSLSNPKYSSPHGGGGGGGASRRWRLRLRDLFLFRGWSEGRRASRRRGSKELKKGSITNGCESGGSINIGGKRVIVSPHELHYTANRAALEETRKKTPLPYHEHTLFGYLGSHHAILTVTRGFKGLSFAHGRS